MSSYSSLLVDLFGRASGTVTITDADGTFVRTDDLNAAGIFADMATDPWVDLVTSTGQAIGIYVAGNGKVVTPAPSVILDDGMVFMIDGNAVPGQKKDFHLCPLAKLRDLNALNWYLPEEVDVQTPGSLREITLMTGRRRDEKQGQWKEIKATFGVFTDALRDHKEGQKDGPCYLQGQSAGGTRKSAAQIENHILGVDLDSGAPLADVMQTIQKYGLEAVIYTTHSHLKDTSVIKRDHFMKVMDATTVEEDDVRTYLIETKGILPAIVDELSILNEAHHTEEGIVILVKHRPMPKFRAVFPLAEPFVFAKRGGSQQDAIAEWKERYAGFCTELGFFFDEKCVDPARLFYLPRHPKGDTTFGSWLLVGDTLDIEKYDRVKMKRRKGKLQKSGPGNAFTDAGIDDDDDERDATITENGFNLRGWASKHAKRFEVQTMIEAVCDEDFIREPRQGGKQGTHVACPFEAEHTSFGGEGTFVVNASDNLDEGFEGGFTFNCVHNACAGRDRLEYLREMIDQELITPEDLTNPDYLLQLEDDEADEEPAMTVAPRKASAEASSGGERSKSQTARDAHQAALNDGSAEPYSVAEGDEDFGDDQDTMLRAFNRRYAVIRTSGGVKILVEPRTPEDDVIFESQNDVSLYEKNRVLFVGGGTKGEGAKKMEAFKLWLEWDRRRTYSKVIFAPGRNVTKDTYNLFRGWPFQPIKGDWGLLRGHIFENICDSNEVLFKWFMTWLAHMFQKPDAKPGSTVVVTGEKGTGKSTVFDYINQLLGRHGITVSQRKQIVGQFNGHLATTLLMVCEEAFWAADPQAEGVLKDMITNKSVLIEKKGYDPIQSDNYTRLALISNSDWVVPASLKDERRFFVLRCSSARRGDLEFFGAVRKQMEEQGGLEALMYELMNYVPEAGPGEWRILFNPPVTAHLQMQQIESLNGVQKFMLELVQSGIYETHDDKVAPIELQTDRETAIRAVDIRAAVEDYVRYRFASDKAKTSFGDISAVVVDWFGAREVKMLLDGSTNRTRMFVFPPLGEVRAKLKEAKGLDIEVMSEEEVKALPARIPN
jgi:energy-coupling factor transporter ATP-binding protein EcfA2